MYEQLISKIKATLETVTAIQVIYPYPTTNLKKYPAAIFFPDAFENSFQSTADNQKVYRFRMFIVVGATQKTKFDIFNVVLPKTVDAVVQAFDDGWDAGTISGHRATKLINSGLWSMAVTQEGLEATAELSLEVRVLTDVV